MTAPWEATVTTAGRLAYDTARAREAPPGEPLVVSRIGFAHEDLRRYGYFALTGRVVLYDDAELDTVERWSRTVLIARACMPPEDR